MIFEDNANIETDNPVASSQQAGGVTSGKVSNLDAEPSYDAYIISNCGNGISDPIKIDFTTDSNLSVDDFKKDEDKIQVFPNPLKRGQDLKITNTKKIQQALVIDLSGRTVIQSQNSTLNIQGLSAGMYYLSIKINKTSIVKKL